MQNDLFKIRDELRDGLLTYHADRKLSHLGSCLSSLEILTALFWGPLEIRDHFVLSKGHAASLLYLILNKKGVLSDTELTQSCRDGSVLGAHPPFEAPMPHPWWGFGSGSLGYGLGLACGVALAKKLKQDSSRVYVLISEGDLNEGSSWEALHFAARKNLNNLTVLLDLNQFQALGASSEIFPLRHMPGTLQNMGWQVQTQDGHDLATIHFHTSKAPQPAFFIFNTQKNKGVEQLLSPQDAHYQWLQLQPQSNS